MHQMCPFTHFHSRFPSDSSLCVVCLQVGAIQHILQIYLCRSIRATTTTRMMNSSGCWTKFPSPHPFRTVLDWIKPSWIEMKWNPCIDLAVAQLLHSIVSQSEVKFKQIICIEPLCLLLVIFVHICSCFPLLKALPKSPYVVNNSGK